MQNSKKTLILFLFAISFTSCQSKFVKAIYNFEHVEPPVIQENIGVALVLGGGGARAIAQLGVIEVLEENNIPIDLIVATSGGSFVGILYADDGNVKKAIDIMLKFKNNDIFTFSLRDAVDGTTNLTGGISALKGERFLEKNMRSKDFKELKIPFVSVATDLISGKAVGIMGGKIPPAIRASCSLPGLFSPVEMYGMLLVDGGVMAPLGVDLAKKYNPKLIIAIDVSNPIIEENVENMFELVHRAANLSYNALNEINGKGADILIKPKLRNIGIFDDSRNKDIYLAGRAAGMEAIGKIREKLGKKQNSNH